MKETIEGIIDKIIKDEENKEYTNKGVYPLFSASSEAKIVIVGQAPGIKAQESKILFNDKSGSRLRSWLNIDEEVFYKSNYISVLPMDFYYPGKGKTGDLPPRKNFTEKWHGRILELMPNVELIILVGSYAQKYYLGKSNKDNLTETVFNYKEYLPKYFPVVHPSPLNFRWINKNPWFEKEVIPDLQKVVSNILKIK